MAHKNTLLLSIILLISIILVVVISDHYWITGTNASQLNGVSLQQNLPTISFTRATDTVIEPDSGNNVIKELSVSISKAPEQEEGAKVTYASANGSATAGVDYMPVTGELTFPVGSTEPQTFEVVILGNNFNQQNRVFVVFLTNSVNAIVGNPAYITVTIVDNDVEARNFLPIIRGHVAGLNQNFLPIIHGHAVGPMPPTPTPCYGYCGPMPSTPTPTRDPYPL